MTTSTTEPTPVRFPALVGRRTASKVPAVTALFWVVKLLSTAGGESIADYLAQDLLGMKRALLTTGSLLAVAVAVQLSRRRYSALSYWTTVGLVGVAGTLITDYLVQSAGATEWQATGGFLIALLITFAAWYATEGTLSIHSIRTTRRELFYWTTVMLTFALGTALGDLTTFTLDWGFVPSIALFAAGFAVAGTARPGFGAPAVPCFWAAYVITRPLGATIADYLAFERSRGALGLGLGPVSLAFAVAIVATVAYLAVTGRDRPDDEVPVAG